MRIRPLICGRTQGVAELFEVLQREGLFDLVNLHIVVDRQIGIANGRTCRRGLMTGAGGELFARAFDRIGVSVAPGARHRQITGRCELVERSTTAIQSDESALGGGDLQQVRTDSGQRDGLRWGRAFVGCGHFLEIEMEGGKERRGSDEKDGQGSHTAIFNLGKQPGQGKE